MVKKRDAATVKAEVEKQAAAIRRLSKALRDEASNGSWLNKLKGRNDILTGHAQTLDGIADALTFAVNKEPKDLSRLNGILQYPINGLISLAITVGATSSAPLPETDMPDQITEEISAVGEATTRVEQAMAEAEADLAPPSSGTTPSNADISGDAAISSDVVTHPWLTNGFETEVTRLTDKMDLTTLESLLDDPGLLEVVPRSRHDEDSIDAFRVDAETSAFRLRFYWEPPGGGPGFYMSDEIQFSGKVSDQTKQDIAAMVIRMVDLHIEDIRDQAAEDEYIQNQIDIRRGK